MAAGQPIATAFVRMRPTFDGFAPALARGIQRDGGARQAGSRLGKGISEGAAREAGRGGHAFARVGTTLGSHLRVGMLTPLRGIGAAFAGTFAAIGAVDVFKGFISEAREAQKTGAQTAAVLKSTGGAARISAKGVSALATAISNNVGVNDEAIQSGENLLLTFTNIRNQVGKGNDVFNQTSAAIVDMTASMNKGEVTSEGLKASSIQVGKALNDPIKGLTALTRVGVTFSDQQKKQIVTLVQHGRTLDAQKIILRELNKEFGGSAAASATAGQKLGVVFKNIEEQVGTALLPVLDHFENWLAARLPGAVNTALGFLRQVRTGFKGLVDLLGHGDFTTAFANAFRVEEDSPVVGAILGIRDQVITVVGQVNDAWDTVAPHLRETVLPGILTAVGGFVKDITHRALDLGTGIFTGLQKGIESGDWEPLGAAVGKIVADTLHRALQTAINIAAWVGEVARKVDWVGLGISIGKQVPSLLIGLAAGILNFDLGSLLKGLAAHWQDILLGILAIAFTPARILGKVAEVLSWIPLAGPILKWAFEHLVRFSKGLVKAVLDALGFMGKAFLEGFRAVFPNIGARFGAWLALLPTRIGIAALNVRAAIGRLIAGLGGAIAGGAGFVARKIGELIGHIISPFAKAGSWLVQAGGQIISGLLSGLRTAWTTVWSWLGGIKGALGRAFNAAGNWLLGIGQTIISGLWQGFKNAMAKVGEILDGIYNAIVDGLKSLFGIDSPSTVMAELGGHIITGLIKGLLLGSGALARTAKNLGELIFSAISQPGTAPAAMQNIVQSMAASLYGWTGGQWDALRNLVMGESGFNPLAQNPTSTAFGMFQFLNDTWASVGASKTADPVLQTAAGLKYIKRKYGDPANAYGKWLSRSPHWYDQGGWLPPGLTLAMNATGRPERILSPRESRRETRPGPLMNIEHYHAHDAADVDLLLGRMSFAERAGGFT